MSKFTKALRQQIIRDFAVRHNGQFNPGLFVEEVRRAGESHPAYEWFEWDEKTAAFHYQVEQARNFARDLRLTFTVEEVSRSRPLVLREREMPLVLSPMDARKRGGGYILTDPDNPDHLAEHCAQAATALDAWLGRFRSAVEHAGGSVSVIEEQARRLHRAGSREIIEAA